MFWHGNDELLEYTMRRDESLLQRPQSEVLDQVTRISSECLEIFSLICRKKKNGELIKHRMSVG